MTTSSNVQFGSPSFSPDGTRLVFTEVMPKTGEDLIVLSMDPSTGLSARGERPEPLLATIFAERNPQISPDGHWLAYESNESGQEDIYVRPFPKVGDGRWQISTGGGSVPRWALGGRELFYRDGNSMISVSVQTTPVFTAGNQTKLFEGRYLPAPGSRTYDVSLDGQRFLMIKDNTAGDQTTTSGSIVVVLNWFEELKAKLAAGK